MNIDDRFAYLENKIQSNFDIFNDKLYAYNNKMNDIMIVDGISSIKKESNFNLNSTSILKFGQNGSIAIFGILFAFVCYILNSSKPAFVCNKILNTDTHFIENKVSFFKLILYSFTISIGIIIVLSISYYIYKMKAN